MRPTYTRLLSCAERCVAALLLLLSIRVVCGSRGEVKRAATRHRNGRAAATQEEKEEVRLHVARDHAVSTGAPSQCARVSRCVRSHYYLVQVCDERM